MKWGRCDLLSADFLHKWWNHRSQRHHILIMLGSDCIQEGSVRRSDGLMTVGICFHCHPQRWRCWPKCRRLGRTRGGATFSRLMASTRSVDFRNSSVSLTRPCLRFYANMTPEPNRSQIGRSTICDARHGKRAIGCGVSTQGGLPRRTAVAPQCA
jgi:hypothetical protein